MRAAQVLAANSLIGNRVINSQGEWLGRVEDLVIDAAQGQIAYAVLSFQGVPGLSGRLYALPWDALALDTEDRTFIIDLAEEMLSEAPAFDRNRWPDMADQRWGEAVHRYYGYRPYWEE
jgi:sporulation protein YlmC with PRC-barrel domain